MSAPLRVLLVGSAGRMGQAILGMAKSTDDLSITATVDRDDAISVTNCDVVVDFSHADVTSELCRACVTAGKPLVTGTTGHSAEQHAELEKAARSIAIVQAANFSVGVNVLFSLTRMAAELLGNDFDLEIVEMHHRMKKDAPSGTAKRLAEILSAARSLNAEHDVKHGREGPASERPANEIGMHSIRGGDVVGDHTVIFAGRGERLELTHRASNRETFAAGALRAARWVVGQAPGLYRMEDVLARG